MTGAGAEEGAPGGDGPPARLLLAGAAAQMAAAGIEAPARDARRLLAHALGIPADRLTLVLGEAVPPPVAARFRALVEERCRRRPLSHLVGAREFFGRVFTVSPVVLDPRPETECLIEAALAAPFTRLIDLGTGSGAIAVTLLAERPAATGVAVDLSPEALAVAAENARRHGVAGRLDLLRSDWWAAVQGQFDLVVANPPYVATDEMAALAPEVRLHEPRLALDGGVDGLVAYRTILAGIGPHLAPGGRVLVEIGPEQGAAVAALFRAAGLVDVVVLPDLDGRDRVVQGMRPCAAGSHGHERHP